MLKISFFFITAIMMVSVPSALGYVADSPKSQYTERMDPHDVKCNESFELIFKSTDFSPACVKEQSIPKLIERGWAVDHIPGNDMILMEQDAKCLGYDDKGNCTAP